MPNFKGKTIVIPGGTGSFGQRIVARLLEYEPKEIRIFSRDEKKHADMRLAFMKYPQVTFFIGDVRDKSRVSEVVRGADIVYFASAMKHIRECELSPLEAVKTNILGAQNVVEASIKNGVEKVVAISTDKAVKPVNVMGMTKAIQERIILRANHLPSNKETKFSSVRYGNVISSRGSVIPYWRDFLTKNQPLRITHPDMTRFLLTLNDAIDLVFYATDNMKDGEIFVKKAPASKLIDLAEVICEMAGKRLKYDIIGIFPGEKMHEILVAEDEWSRTKDKKDFFVISHACKYAATEGEMKEYSSKDEVVSKKEIRKLIERSDREFAELTREGIFFHA